MAFKYKQRSADAWEKRATQQGGDFAGFILDEFKTFTPAKGDNFLRILPPTWEDAEHYGLDVWVHYGIGPERASALCLNKMRGQRCPICEAMARAERAQDEELAKELKAGKRILVWVLDRKEETKGPMVWSMPWSLDRDLCKVARDPRSGEVYMLDDPDNGYDVSFEKTGDKLTTKYTGVQLARKPSFVEQDFLDYIEAAPLPDCLLWRDYDELKALYEGGSAIDEPAPAPEPTRAPPRRPAAREEPEPARPAAGKGGSFTPRGGRAAPPPPEEDPPPADEEDYGAPPEDEPAPEPEPTRAPPRRPAAREEPEPPRAPPRRTAAREEPEPAAREAASGSSRAAELRARFARK